MTDHLGEEYEAAQADGFTPSDAFQGLGDEARTAVLLALAAEEPRTFSELHEASGVDTSAGFAYHLRQLDGQFVRQREDERYELTTAGREVARGIRSGRYTDSVDRDPVELAEPCPFCRETALVARVTDSVTEVACEACGTPLLGLSLPPSGYATRDADSVPAALDSYYRHRIRTFSEGVCPDCGGTVTATVEPVTRGESADCGQGDETQTEHDRTDHDGTDHLRVQAAFDCDGCGGDLRCPLSLTVLDNPAVVSFYRDHGEDLDERPVWNVGPEWRERVVSRDPWCVLVSTRLDDDVLDLYLSVDGTVVGERRRPVSGQSGPAANHSSVETTGSGPGDEESPREEPPGDDAPA